MEAHGKLKHIPVEVAAARIADALKYLYLNADGTGQRGRFQLSRDQLRTLARLCGNKKDIRRVLLLNILYAASAQGLVAFSLSHRKDDMIFVCSADYLLKETTAFSDEELFELLKDIPADLGDLPFCAHLGQRIMAQHPGKSWGLRRDQIGPEILERISAEPEDDQAEDNEDDDDLLEDEEDEEEIDPFNEALGYSTLMEHETGFNTARHGVPVICASPVAYPHSDDAFVAFIPRDIARGWRQIDDKVIEEAARYGIDATAIEY